MATLFVSDLHLAEERPATNRLFLDFLDNQAKEAEALYILGDLFEVWLGDDLLLPVYKEIVEGMRRLSDHGVPVYVMPGNRDFLLGREFENMSGCTLIGDPTVIGLYGNPTLLMHGDTLCTDDHAYQELRRTVRRPEWIASFLKKLPAERIAFARQLRDKSREETGKKDSGIMDINSETVRAEMAEHRVNRLIHGHTHRPGIHDLTLNGHQAQRLVLGDWHREGSVLSCEKDGCRLLRLT